MATSLVSTGVTFSDGTTQTTAAVSTVKAWVNFNGANASIRASSGFSSITYISSGVYRGNMSPPLVDANYALAVSGGFGSVYDSGANVPVIAFDSYGNRGVSQENRTSSTFKIISATPAEVYPLEQVNIVVCR